MKSPDPVAFTRKRELLRIAGDEIGRAGKRLVLFVPPLHPEIRAAMKPPLSEWFQAMLDSPGAAVFDHRDSEDDPSFRDGLHLNAEAAERVTRRLAEELRATGVWQPPATEPVT